MADTVQFYMEEMIPEMRDLEQKGIFSKVRSFFLSFFSLQLHQRQIDKAYISWRVDRHTQAPNKKSNHWH